MSPHLTSKTAAVTVKSETSYQSPPSSLSDISQPDLEDIRGRRQGRDRSVTAKGEGESGDEKGKEGDNGGGKQRKRKRSRKGLEKNFPCPHQDCGKSYSRAEHLYRHQLNRESLCELFRAAIKIDRGDQIRRRKSILVTILAASVNSFDKTYALDIERGILPVAHTFSERTTTPRRLMIGFLLSMVRWTQHSKTVLFHTA